MVDISGLRSDLADVLAAGLTDWRIYSYVPAAPNVPALVVGFPDEITFGVNIAGNGLVNISIIAVVGRISERTAQTLLDTALSSGVSGSVVDVLQGADPEGRAWRTCKVVSAGDLRVVTVGTEIDLLAADINLELIAR